MIAKNFCSIVFFSTSQLLIFFILNSSLSHAAIRSKREALEIIIGDPSPTEPECSPPTPPPIEPPCPPPPPPPIEPPCPPPPSPPPPPPPPPPPRPPKPSPSPSSPFPLSAELRQAIRAIQKFKNSITSDPFNITGTWNGNNLCKDPNSYKGFICFRNKVASVNFNEKNISSKPQSLNTFFKEVSKSLVIIHLNSNFFTGSAPFDISSEILPKLFELDLSNNKLAGSFPKAVLGGTNLTYLDVRFNQLTGPVDPKVFTLDLDVLFLNNNFFSGEIPTNLGQTPVLFLTLANNKFTGPIPKSIGQASANLIEVLLLNNQLTGCLPYEIGKLKFATVFDASVNKLFGPIPQSFGCLKEMQIMNLSHNQLDGTVPETLCKLMHLQELDLKYNYFTQVGPECRKAIKNKVLDISMNCIRDFPNQRKDGECSAYFSKQPKCPDMNSLKIVPCDIHDFSSKKISAPAHRNAKHHSTTYAAIKNHHH